MPWISPTAPWHSAAVPQRAGPAQCVPALPPTEARRALWLARALRSWEHAAQWNRAARMRPPRRMTCTPSSLRPAELRALVGGCSGAASRRRVEPIGSHSARPPAWGGARVRPLTRKRRRRDRQCWVGGPTGEAAAAALGEGAEEARWEEGDTGTDTGYRCIWRVDLRCRIFYMY